MKTTTQNPGAADSAHDYSARVRAYEAQGMTTSDAQGCVDAEVMTEARATLLPALLRATFAHARARHPSASFSHADFHAVADREQEAALAHACRAAGFPVPQSLRTFDMIEQTALAAVANERAHVPVRAAIAELLDGPVAFSVFLAALADEAAARCFPNTAADLHALAERLSGHPDEEDKPARD